MRTSLPDNVHLWLARPLADEVKGPLAKLSRAHGVQRVAVMPDVHFAKGVCIGTVVAARDVIYPEAVGGDIGCGVLCLPFAGDLDRFARELDIEAFYDTLRECVPALRHREREELPQDLLDDSLEDRRLARLRDRDGSLQFGTLGRGNHFLELQRDETNRPWLMIHSA